EGTASIRLRYEGGGSWVGVAWQHPPDNLGDQDGGHDLTGADKLELWPRGECGDEKIDIGVRLIDESKANPDSDKTVVKGIVLKREWQRYEIPVKRLDLSNVKTGFVASLVGRRGSSVTLYLDKIRLVR
ncbi:MAG: hypothetical protein WBN65_04775, partial [Gammaproteobacteria bacterium]